MGQFVLGVDGGGTKTQCALFRTNGDLVDLIRWESSNYEMMQGGFPELKEELNKLLNYVLNKNSLSLSDITQSVFGLAGVDTAYQHRTISGILTELGMENHILCNDAFLGVKAGAPCGYGICAINGTGCTIAGIDPDGRMLQIGGQGVLTGDKGGGEYLGASAVSAVYEYLYKGGVDTRMTKLLFERMNIHASSDFMDAVISGMNRGDFRIKDFNKVVFQAANAGDQVALDILYQMGKDNARSINSLIKELNYRACGSLDVVLAGSIYVKGENPAAVEKLKADVVCMNKNIRIVFHILQQPPVMGAVLWALRHTTRMRDFCELFDKVKLQLQHVE